MFSTENPFKKVGITLLVIGGVDILVMIYCIINEIGYSSIFNIFSLIAGIFLIKGSIKTARIVRWSSVFFFIMIIGAVVGISLIMPFDLLKLQIKLNAWSAVGLFLFLLIFLSLMIWIYRQLSTADALRLFARAGYKIDRPLSAYLSGAFVLIVMIGMSTLIGGSESGKKAKELAQQQLGNGFQYYVSSISSSGNSGQANVIAYSHKEIRKVQVNW
ncbi:hypothetical protein [Acinetobacter venetianus]|uniref:Uncharacterized protein n=1 Tax=Acinetobacter venetianus TaxID=52133 RepID=A0A150HRW5_9GAMM|nr:hypothetical protein [Acinetobacter venetianus]KXZ69015.1 hypothetical protein AVENLUH13518_02783 [Acinetobacter venetianus]